MSSVSSVGSSQDLYSVLQSLTAQDTSNTTTAASQIDAGQDPSSTDGTSESQGHHHHHHGIPSQIESAVTNALQNLQPGEDPNQAIQDAISNQLKAAGGQTAGGSSTTPTSTDPTSSTSSASSTSDAEFQSLLKSFNIDPQQFKQDFQTAVKNVNQGGNVDFPTLFQSFPPGSAIDTTA
jgi:hypothetical protein